MVYSKPPFGGPEYVLQYLGRYTHRVAISNHRLVSLADGQVTFRWRDSADHNQKKLMTLSLDEFLRRFLLHLLPKGFVRIRHFGFLANRSKKQALGRCRKLFDLDPVLPPSPFLSAKDLLLKIIGVDLSRCPSCREGTMIVVGDLLASLNLPRWDSS